MDLPDGPCLIADLLDQHAAALELYAAQWSSIPQDCVQEAFIRLAKYLEKSGKPPEYTTAWLYQVVRNQARNTARAQRRRKHHEQIAARLSERKSAEQITQQDKLSLLESLDTLSSADREIVVLRNWSELTWQEIAKLTKTSSSSAQRTYVAALSKLRQHLEPSCPTNPICPPS